jgi:hypothetical protein
LENLTNLRDNFYLFVLDLKRERNLLYRLDHGLYIETGEIDC